AMGVGRSYHIIGNAGVQSTEDAPVAEVKRGAFETMEAGRSCDISAACHWAVNMAASGQHGKMWGHAYSVTPAGIYVAAESSIRRPEDLKGREVGVESRTDRKSTRLNSSHLVISYAVFCLKKKKKTLQPVATNMTDETSQRV